MTPNPPEETFWGGNRGRLRGPRSSSFEHVKRFCMFWLLLRHSSEFKETQGPKPKCMFMQLPGFG
eukprot:2395074-Alexandrium_andersonii.AAC.1